MKKIVFIAAAPETISAFLHAYVNTLAKSYDVHVATTLNKATSIRGINSNITLHDIAIAREPSVISDLKSLYALFAFLSKHKFDVVHSFTPKAGLLSQISAFFARSPIRLHTFTGQVWATKTGLARQLLKLLDTITAKLSTHCLVDSPSQQQFLIDEGLLTDKNSDVLAQGSVSGVNLTKFSYNAQARQSLRQLHKVDESDFIFLFVGRLKVEKGIPELIEAFQQLSKVTRSSSQKIKLFVIGSDEDNLSSLMSGNENIEYIGFKTNVNEYYAFADVLCLPSHREGFGNVIIEASACNLPAIASNIYGLSDAVEDGFSGLLHPVKDANAIHHCMEKIIDTPNLLVTLRENGRKRVEQVFDEKVLVEAFLDFYRGFLR